MSRLRARKICFRAAIEALTKEPLKKYVPVRTDGDITLGTHFFNAFVRASYRITDREQDVLCERVDVIRGDRSGRLEMHFANGRLRLCLIGGGHVPLPIDQEEEIVVGEILHLLRETCFR